MSEQKDKRANVTFVPKVVVKGAGRYAPPVPVTPPTREAEPKREEQDHG
jgi:hypothetical protein